MARLLDSTDALSAPDREALDRMAAARADADGRAALGDVYVRMFNNPAVARAVGALGKHLRFTGALPDDARELVILRYAATGLRVRVDPQVASACRTRGSASRRQSTAPTGLRGRATTSSSAT